MRVFTWNMQGSSAATETKWQTVVLNFFSQGDADVVCLQECGAVPSSAGLMFGYGGIPFVGAKPTAAGNLHGYAASFYQWGTARTLKNILFMKTDPASNRVNLAIVSRDIPTSFVTAAPGLLGARPALGVRLGAGPVWDVFSIHAWSPGGNDAKRLLAKVVGLAGLSANWAVLGDYNRLPSKLTVPPGAAMISVPNGPTRLASNKILDYMVAGGRMVNGVRPNIGLSDHCPVQFDI